MWGCSGSNAKSVFSQWGLWERFGMWSRANDAAVNSAVPFLEDLMTRWNWTYTWKPNLSNLNVQLRSASRCRKIQLCWVLKSEVLCCALPSLQWCGLLRSKVNTSKPSQPEGVGHTTIAFFSCRPARPRPRPRRLGQGHGRLATATATRPRPRPPGHTQPATATASQPRPARPRPATCHGHRPRPPDQDSATQPLATRQSCCFAGYKGGCCDLCRLVWRARGSLRA